MVVDAVVALPAPGRVHWSERGFGRQVELGALVATAKAAARRISVVATAKAAARRISVTWSADKSGQELPVTWSADKSGQELPVDSKAK
jgi:hypothetical protein